MIMDDLIPKLENRVANFAEVLPKHLEKWKCILQESAQYVKALANFAEQLRAVENAKIKHMEDFKQAQEGVQFKILNCIDEELCAIKEIISELNKVNQEFKNKLTLLENLSVELDWNDELPLITGSAIQPSLKVVLERGLEYWTYFSSAFKTINDTYKEVDVRRAKTVTNLENAFNVDVDERKINYFVALMQYVGKENTII